MHIKTEYGNIYCSSACNNSFGPAVCFFGGFASPASSGTKALHLLSLAQTTRAFRFVSFDYSGCGMSDGDSYTNFHIGDWYRNCIDVINHFFKNERVIICGSSMGGWLGLRFAIDNPHKTSAVLGLASAPDFTKDIELSTSGPFPREKKEDDYRYEISEKLIRDGKQHFVLNGNSIDINCPITLIHGMKDTCVSYQKSLEIADKVTSKKVKLILLKNAIHGLSDKNSLTLISDELKKLMLQ